MESPGMFVAAIGFVFRNPDRTKIREKNTKKEDFSISCDARWKNLRLKSGNYLQGSDLPSSEAFR
jgi:hypothetical protein